MNRFRTLHCFTLILAAAAALAQGTRAGDSARAYRKSAPVASSPLNVRTLPKIDPKLSPVRNEIENMFEPAWMRAVGEPSSGLIGEMVPGKLIKEGARWPSVNDTRWTPGDPSLAVGPNHVVVTVNTRVAIYNKAGVQASNVDLATFFSGMSVAPVSVFDPRVTYDISTGRYYLIVLDQSGVNATFPQGMSRMYLAVSRTNDPTGVWDRYWWDARYLPAGGGSRWMDYPALGFSNDAIILNGNMFQLVSPGGNGGVQFMVIPKSNVLAGAPAAASYVFFSNAFTAQGCDVIDSPTGYALARQNSTTLQVFQLNNLLTTPTISSVFVTVPSFSSPGSGALIPGGGRIDALDGRILSAQYRAGRIVASHGINSADPFQGRWYEVSITPSPFGATVLQTGNITSSGFSCIMPAIHQNAFRDTAAVFTRCSSTQNPQFAVAGRLNTDPAGQMTGPTILANSTTTTYTTSTSARWGDYFAVAVDPVDQCTFWGVAMMTNGTQWRTEVNSWTVSAPRAVGLNAVAPVNGGTSTTGTVTLSGTAQVGGTVVNLTSSNPAILTVPATVTIPEGATSATYTINTTAIAPPNQNVTISASALGTSANTSVQVKWVTANVGPSSFTSNGFYPTGDLNALQAIDGVFLSVQKDPASVITNPVIFECTGTVPTTTPSAMTLRLNFRNRGAGAAQASISAWNWSTNSWVLLRRFNVTRTFVTLDSVISGPAAFVNASGQVRMQVSVLPEVPSFEVRNDYDLVQWIVTQ